MRWRRWLARSARHPVALPALTIDLVWPALAYVRPGWLLPLMRPEGPVEHASHLVLALGVVLALAAAARLFAHGVRRVRRWGAPLLLAAFLAFVLMEETDWGGVYTGHSLIYALRHDGSFHALGHEPATIFHEPQTYVGLAFAALLAWPLVRRARALFGARRRDAEAFLVLAASWLWVQVLVKDAAVVARAGGEAATEQASKMDVFQLLVYAAVLVVLGRGHLGMRRVRRAGARGRTGEPAAETARVA